MNISYKQLAFQLTLPNSVKTTAPQILGANPTPAQIVAKIFAITLAIASVAFLVLLLTGGVMYLTSAGSKEGLDKAKRVILDAVVGLVISVSSFALGYWILTVLQIV